MASVDSIDQSVESTPTSHKDPAEGFAEALLALALEAGIEKFGLELPKNVVEIKSESDKEPEESSGWHSTVMLRTWQMDSDMIALNNEWMRRSIQAGRNAIPEELIGRFLDPKVPIEQLFTKIKTLGKGAFGTTGLWKDGEERLFAIKELEPKLGNGSSDFEIGLALDHPNIVRIHNFVQKWSTPKEIRRYLIMEYIDGGTLKSQKLDLEQRVQITREMLFSALYMFKRGVLPLDLHRENLMVTKEGQWKWIDLGIYQPLACASRLTLSSYFKQLARLVRRTLQPSDFPEASDRHFPPLKEIVEMFRDMPQYDQPMTSELLPLLEAYCNVLVNWLNLYQESAFLEDAEVAS